jgi:hypothetical protein
MKTHNTKFTVHIELAAANTVNKLAEGHLAFKGGPLDGCTVGGLTVWASRSGNGENVTARAYSNGNGEKKTFSFIQGEAAGMSQLRHVVLEAYRDAKQAAPNEALAYGERGATRRPVPFPVLLTRWPHDGRGTARRSLVPSGRMGDRAPTPIMAAAPRPAPAR